MYFLDLTLSTPEENLALDEALLVTAEADGAEFLRVWESPTYFVTLGKNCSVRDDVWGEQCEHDKVPILRRVSGGGTVLQGPGCLNYALVLAYARAECLVPVDGSFRYVLDRVCASLAQCGVLASPAGSSDLVVGQSKISGNSQRRQRSHFLHHGTILHGFDLAAIGKYLREPVRRPAYRADRPHHAFVTNVLLDVRALRLALRHVWQADELATEWPRSIVSQLIAEKYSRREWNLRR